jgi:hypothetical protein
MKTAALTLTALAFVLVLFTGCGEPASAHADVPEQSWDWNFYPPLNKMRLASLPCQLLPKSTITIHSPLVGVLRVYVTSPQTNLPAGHVWAEFEPAIFAAEAEALEEARVKLEERERLQLELEMPRQRLKLEKEFEEAQRQVSILHLLSTNSELAEATFKIPGQSGNPLKPQALDKARVELGLLKQSLDYLESTNLSILGIDLPGQRSEWQRRKLEFERQQSRARLKMPFPGQLTVSLPLTEGVEEYPVNVSQELGVARDLSLIRVRVSVANPAWVGLPTDRLWAVVRMPGGPELRAGFLFQKIERVQTREESVYYFQIPENQSGLAARLMGTDVTCDLWVGLPEPVRVVPKLSLVLQQPGAFQGRSWAQGVGSAWPGAQVIVEGQTELAIALPAQNKKL